MKHRLSDDLLPLLYELEDFLDNQADADYEGERYIPNKAMKLQMDVERMIVELEDEEEACFL